MKTLIYFYSKITKELYKTKNIINVNKKICHISIADLVAKAGGTAKSDQCPTLREGHHKIVARM